LEQEDHNYVVRDEESSEELPCDAFRLSRREEVKEAVKAEDKKDEPEKIPGDDGNKFS
jgi:hypothetical protein